MTLSHNPDEEIRLLIDKAVHGDSAALGELLEQYRPLLVKMAQGQLKAGLQARIGESDIVQKSCQSAIRNFNKFSGADPDEFGAWLQEIHKNNIRDIVRNHQFQKRDVRRDQTLLLNSAAPQARQETPSHLVMKAERVQSLKKAIATLPPDQKEAVSLKHIEGLGISRIAEIMGRSQTAVAGLLKRGLATLRERLQEPE